jgi:hypothetical protein
MRENYKYRVIAVLSPWAEFSPALPDPGPEGFEKKSRLHIAEEKRL